MKNSKGRTDNSMTTSSKQLFYAWRPNNFRRRIKIDSLSSSGVKRLLTTIPVAKQNGHTNIISIKDYCDNITVQIAKESVTFIWKQERVRNVKKWYSISGYSLDVVQGKVDNLKAKITSLLDSAASMLSKQTGLKYLGVPVWTRYEDALKGDSFLDSLPSDVVIHAEHFKKVYRDEVEFVGKTGDEPTVKMVQYVHNRVVERFTPEICKELNHLHDLLCFYNGDLKVWFDKNIVSLDDLDVHKDLICGLPFDRRLLLSKFLFERFGGVYDG